MNSEEKETRQPSKAENKVKQEEKNGSSELTGKMASSRSIRRGRRPAKLDTKVRLERSQQSARECRARKKLRYQYLEELVASREKAIYVLRDELEMYKKICQDVDEGIVPSEVEQLIEQHQNQPAD
jgi:hypothetical protein